MDSHKRFITSRQYKLFYCEKVTPDDVRNIDTALRDPNLVELDFHESDITDDALIFLTPLFVNHLEWLHLGRGVVTMRGVRAVLSILASSKLQGLTLFDMNLSTADLSEIITAVAGSNLQILNLDGNPIDDAGVSILTKGLGKSKLQHLHFRKR